MGRTGAQVFFLAGLCALFARPALAQEAGGWVNISDAVVNPLIKSGTKIPWPGGTGGVAVDPASGDVYMVVTGLGLWHSADHGRTFVHVADGKVSGRCETGFALNFDPAGSRYACFTLDGKGGMSLDAGKTWTSFADVGRNWEYGAVDWSDPHAASMFALHHESGGEMYLSTDAGKSWKQVAKDPAFFAVGIFDAHTLAASKGDGILRSIDGGATWSKVSDFHPLGRVAIPFKGTTFWLAKEGLIQSTDRGAHWQKMGEATGAAWGPMFGKDQTQMVVADAKGFLRTDDAGKTWRRIAPLPPVKEFAPKLPGQFLSIAWDSQANILYASCMSNPTYRLQLK